MAPEKRRRHRTIAGLPVLCLLLGLLVPVRGQAVAAQGAAEPESVVIQQLQVQVLPEFDDPRVLVIVQGRVAADEFPVRVTFRVPQSAQINQMATVNMGSAGTTAAEYEAAADPEDARWQLVTYELEGAHFFYEYYYDPIVGDEEKEFTYTLSSYHGVEEAVVEVQQPKAAEGFRTEPEAVSMRLDENLRLYYHRVVVGSLGKGQEVSVRVSYRKADPEPSLTWAEVMALQEGKRPPEIAAAESEAEFPIPLEVVVFVGGAVLLLLGAYIGYRLRVGDAAAEKVSEAEAGPYCRMCGAGLKAEAGYCHRCGAMVMQGARILEEAAATPRPDRERR